MGPYPRGRRCCFGPFRARVPLLVLLVLATLGLAACASSPPAASSASTPTESVAPNTVAAPTAAAAAPDATARASTAGGAALTFAIGTDKDVHTLRYLTSRITAPNTEVTVTFTNSGVVAHTLFFRQPMTGRTKLVVSPSQSDTFTFTTPSEAGTYQFICTHYEGGMFGTLEVQ